MDGISMRSVLENMISTLVVEQYQLKADTGVLFSFEVQGYNDGFENDGDTRHEDWVRDERVFVYVLAVRPHNIFISIRTWEQERDTRPDLPPMDTFENTSEHDSCWRSDGLNKVWGICAELADAARAPTPKEHKKTSALGVREDKHISVSAVHNSCSDL